MFLDQHILLILEQPFSCETTKCIPIPSPKPNPTYNLFLKSEGNNR